MKRNITASTRILIDRQAWSDELETYLSSYSDAGLAGLTRDEILDDLIQIYEDSEPDYILTDDRAESYADADPLTYYVLTLSEIADEIWGKLEPYVRNANLDQDIDWAAAGWVLDEDAVLTDSMPVPHYRAKAHNTVTGEEGSVFWMIDGNPWAYDEQQHVRDWACCAGIDIYSDPIFWLIDYDGTQAVETVINETDAEEAIVSAWLDWAALSEHDKRQRTEFYVALANSDPETGGMDYNNATIIFDCKAFNPELYDFVMSDLDWANYIGEHIGRWQREAGLWDEDDVRRELLDDLGDPYSAHLERIRLNAAGVRRDSDAVFTLDEAVKEIVQSARPGDTFYAVLIGDHADWNCGSCDYDDALQMAREAMSDPNCDGERIAIAKIDVEYNACEGEEVLRKGGEQA